jgi:hypothetical protein
MESITIDVPDDLMNEIAAGVGTTLSHVNTLGHIAFDAIQAKLSDEWVASHGVVTRKQ